MRRLVRGTEGIDSHGAGAGIGDHHPIDRDSGASVPIGVGHISHSGLDGGPVTELPTPRSVAIDKPKKNTGSS